MNFLLALVIIVVLAKILSELFERIGLISLLGEFGAGLILGVSGLAIISAANVEEFAFMGVILLMFLAGYEETDIRFMVKKRKKLSIISISGLLLTLIILFFFCRQYFHFNVLQSVLFCFIFGLTDVAVGAKALLSTGKINTKLGESLLGIAVIDTVIGLLLLVGAITVFTSTSVSAAFMTFGKIVLFFIITVFIAKYIPKLIHKAIKMRTEMMDVSIAFISIFFLAYLAEELRLAAVLGAYFAGLILQKAPDLETDHFSTTIKSMSYGFFIPIFFAWIALSADISLIPKYIKPALIICIVALAVKFIIIFIASLTQKAKPQEALVYSTGMLAKGADNLIVLAIAVNINALSAGIAEMLLTSLVFILIVSVIVGSVSLKKLLA